MAVFRGSARVGSSIWNRAFARRRDHPDATAVHSTICLAIANTVRRWALDLRNPFSAQYARAREFGYHRMFDEILEIADDSTNDYVRRLMDNGETFLVLNTDHIARSKLRVETRKWFLARTLPKILRR
jgi:hypothetical protein